MRTDQRAGVVLQRVRRHSPARCGPLEAATVQNPHVEMRCQARARLSLRCDSKVAAVREGHR
jgi:hypothetical protein